MEVCSKTERRPLFTYTTLISTPSSTIQISNNAQEKGVLFKNLDVEDYIIFANHLPSLPITITLPQRLCTMENGCTKTGFKQTASGQNTLKSV